MSKRSDDAVIRKMAQLLKSGAAMLDRSCPACNVPLFRLKTGEIICPSCGQKFVIVSSDEEELEVYGNLVVRELERSAVMKLSEVSAALRSTSDPESLREILSMAIDLLKVIELSRKVRRGKRS